MTDSEPKRRFFHPTPGKLLIVLLATEGILLFANWFHWIPKGWAVLIAVAAVGVFLIGMLLWLVVALVFHRQFQFSIRSLLVLTVAVAIPASWLTVEMKVAREQHEVVVAIEQAGGSVEYYVSLEEKLLAMYEGQTLEPKWLLNIFGKDYFYDVTLVSLNGTLPEHMSRFLQLNTLMFFHVNVTDDMPLDLQGFSHLTSLTFWDSNLNNAGLQIISKIKNLKDLDLIDTNVTDEGLVYLHELRELESLGLYSLNDIIPPTAISDQGLLHLARLQNLKSLTLANTLVTDEGVRTLQQALPNCIIDHRFTNTHLNVSPAKGNAS